MNRVFSTRIRADKGPWLYTLLLDTGRRGGFQGEAVDGPGRIGLVRPIGSFFVEEFLPAAPEADRQAWKRLARAAQHRSVPRALLRRAGLKNLDRWVVPSPPSVVRVTSPQPGDEQRLIKKVVEAWEAALG